jgi:TRAP-type C4-dicarboxylate transport system permease small subunit
MEQAFRRMVRLNTWLKQAEKALGCICLGALFVVMITNAGLRYCLQSGLNWSDELNQFLFVWMGFLAAAYTAGEDKHLNVTALIGMFPKTIQLFVRQVMNGIMIVFFLLYLPELITLLGQLAISNVMRIPLKYVYAILPVSFGLMSFHIACNMISDIREFLKDKNEKGREIEDV